MLRGVGFVLIRDMDIYLIAHNIRSLYNVGSLFRTADGAGVEKIYLTGYTAAPVDKFKRPVKEIAKVALGAELTTPWEKTKDLGRLIARLQREGVFVAALEQAPDAVSIFKDLKIPKSDAKSIALIVGNEVRGISPTLIKKCNLALEIPMFGKKESLNVVVAAGIAIFKLRELLGGIAK